MLNKYENSLDTSDCLGNTQQDKILEQEKDTVTPTEHEEIYENDVTPPTGNHIINTVADLLLQPNAVIAIIHDLVVAPEVSSESESYSMERRLLENELKRVRNFSLLSENSDDTLKELDDITSYYNLSLF
ncbi:hypothetical protein [Phocaeicola vulgatus]|uniref:hypothetical protein n=1 Tax=Phocaeicola vulgatus TaxID=821 RepID=UPI0039B3B0AE|nr:hypothetical protein [Phocaeicola vulgatus]